MSSFSGSGSAGGSGPQIGDAAAFVATGYFASNIALTGVNAPTGGTAANGQVVLVGGQTTPSENGLYVVDTGGAWSRLSYYTGSLAASAEVHVISPASVMKRAVFVYNGTVAPVVIGTSSIGYSLIYSEGNASSLNIREGAAGNSSVSFMANGGGIGSTISASITRSSGVNGTFVITNTGSGLFSLTNPSGQITIQPAFSLNLSPGITSNINMLAGCTTGQIIAGASGSTENTTPRIILHGPTSATAGIATPPNRITTGSASSPTARQLQMFFDPAGAAIASYTVTLPASTALIDGQEMLAHSGAFGVTALTLTAGAGTTIRGAITTLAADSFARYKYIAATTTWVRIG